MLVQVRQSTFETNSSSVHALVIFDGLETTSFPSTIELKANRNSGEQTFMSLRQKLEVISVLCFYAERTDIWNAVLAKLAQKGTKVVPAERSEMNRFLQPNGELKTLSDEERTRIENILEKEQCDSEYYDAVDDLYPLKSFLDPSDKLYEKLVSNNEWFSNFLFDERSYIAVTHGDDIPIDPVEGLQKVII